MATNYKFPRVDVSSYARVKTTARPDTPDTTVLFMPIMSPTGPSGEIIKIHDLDEYASYFGKPDFSKMGVSAIAITRWLNAGGTLYAYRLNDKKTGSGYPDYATFKLDISKTTATGGDDAPAEGMTVHNILTFRAKYVGTEYNKVWLRLTPMSADGKIFTVETGLTGNSTANEKYNRIEASRIGDILNATSSLIADFTLNLSQIKADFSELTEMPTLKDIVGDGLELRMTETDSFSNTISNNGGQLAGMVLTSKNSEKFESSGASYYDLLRAAYRIGDGSETFNGEVTKLLLNVNATPVDLLLDPGYPADLKELFYDSIRYVLKETSREDLFVALSRCMIKERWLDDGTKCPDGKVKPEEYDYFGTMPTYQSDGVTRVSGSNGIPYTYNDNAESSEMTEVAGKMNGWFNVWDQWGLIDDNIYNDGAELNIPLSIMYAVNVAYNDVTYGMHRPTAGERYGVVSYKQINSNPDAKEKDNLFRKRFNYMEKSARSTEIMTNRTFYHEDATGLQSPLDFTNNVRVKNKIVRDLRKILRKYLYEYADGDTLLRCHNECNAYINGWINAKAISTGYIEIAIDDYTEEYLYAKLYLKFKGVVEYIDVSIYLD